MATHHLIRTRGLARRGDPGAQIELAKVYLNGAPGLMPSVSAALIWLERAARQGEITACELIGKHVPLAMARAHSDPDFLIRCYQAAAARGCPTAGMTLAQWLLDAAPPVASADALAQAASWARRTADSGNAAVAALLAQALSSGRLTPHYAGETTHYQRLAAGSEPRPAAPDGATMLALLHRPELSPPEARRLLQYYLEVRDEHRIDPDAAQALHRAACAGIADAQFHYGLWLGKFDHDGQRVKLTRALGVPKVGPALSWLRQAAAQEHGDAWFVLAMLYRNARYACHDHGQYLYCLQRATQLGCVRAQTYLGRKLWRNRRSGIAQWAEAAYWLWRAARAGDAEAQALLPKAMGHAPAVTPWCPLVHYLDTLEAGAVSAQLSTRLRLAASFGLNRAEMLWLDPRAPQREHCLVVDISAQHAGHAPRLIAIQTPEQRQRVEQFRAQSWPQQEHAIQGQRLVDELAAFLAAARRANVPASLPDSPTPHAARDMDPAPTIR